MATASYTFAPGIDLPPFHNLPLAPATAGAGSCVTDDNGRMQYWLFSTSQFWQYDTFAHTWQQLANLPGGTLAAGSCLRYVRQIGAQLNGAVYGSVYAFVASGSAVVFYRYNEADNTWSAALSVTGIPAAWGTDGRLICPEPILNAYAGGYHAAALATITTTALAAAGATTIAVSALAAALPSGAVLNFGTATTPVWAVLTAAAAAAATSITVAALLAPVPSASTALFYPDLFLFGNNAQVAYRYNFATGLWYTTSANSGNPAIPAVGGAIGAGCVAVWLPGSGDTNALDRIILVQGGGSAVIREYSLSANTFAAVTYYPATETFTTGTASGVRHDATGRSRSLLLHKDTTGRIYEFTRANVRMTPKMTQWLVPYSTAYVGNRMCVMKHAGQDFVYLVTSNTQHFVRSPILF